MWNSPLRNAIPAMGQRMATLFVPDHLDLEYADYLYQQVMPTLRQDIAEAWEAAEIAARIKEKWIEAVTRATALFGEVLLGWYRAYYVYVRERDIDTFAGSWGNWRDEVRACFDDVSKAYNEFAELWPEVMKHGDTETPCKLAFAQSAMGGVKRALMMIERPGFEPRL
jgi:hypothetical protein